MIIFLQIMTIFEMNLDDNDNEILA